MPITTVVLAFLIGINTHTTVTVSEPYYAPLWDGDIGDIGEQTAAELHLAPYEMKEMAITVHRDLGWPLTHTRASNHFRAHNAGAYLMDGGLEYDLANPETNYLCVAADLGIGVSILLAMALVF